MGVRRESVLGPHLGAGLGGKWELTDDLDSDRDAVIETHRKLIKQVERGDLDRLLTLERPIRQNRDMSQEHLRHTLADYTSGDGNIEDLRSAALGTAGQLADRVVGALTEYENSVEDEGALRARLSPLVREFAP